MSDWRSRSMQRLSSFSRPVPSSEEIQGEASPAAALEDPEDILALPLPIEISNSIQSFLVNLTSPIHKAPFNPEKLTAMFQDFYSGTFDLMLDLLPEPGKLKGTQEEMLTKEAMQARKVRRAAFEEKHAAWREDVEERVCLEMYESLFELRTSTDELRDEALMSKIIAISLIGVTLEQLGVPLSREEVDAMRPTITLVGENLQNLNNAMTPRSKLDILLQCHKQIVDEVQQSNSAGEDVHTSDVASQIAEATSAATTNKKESSDTKHLGADAILPIFIYAIIKSNPAKLVSHYEFICRFRAQDSLTGEMAYCLTNLEAAIGFLETFEFTDGQDAGDPLTSSLGPTSSYQNRSGSQASLLTVGSGARASAGALSGSLRASERARALSSAANDVYELADERMKQFGSQLGAIVSRVSEHQSLDEVRHLVGLPGAGNANPRPAADRQKFVEIEQRVKARKAREGTSTPPRSSRPVSMMETSSLPASSSPLKQAPASPGKSTSSTTLALQTSPAAGTLSRSSVSATRPLSGSAKAAGAASASRFSGFGMIRNFSNTLVGRAPAPTAEMVRPREMTSNATIIERRFLEMETDDLTMKDVAVLLASYKQLVASMETTVAEPEASLEKTAAEAFPET
ncbi:hypothetical protein BCR37DRAFT_393429 [Protomyces lactucae-debilis]|uniref:VPS9 domain-containing protein n=1 Tax=Protomyces lactucae-debilis TaxID=2754530 RepID=A0A1Y2FCD5_PROLT|nr:uncharacterized protein BCR37DRAFT_393429 [Protomyces lactucae-debilis]ORY81588.1 hypothetical protein BCR37DRAFT_393429 [Protomyces lactucae-debilis]